MWVRAALVAPLIRILTLRHRTAAIFFFFNDTATTEIYTLSLHDALPIYPSSFQNAIWSSGCPRAQKCIWTFAVTAIAIGTATATSSCFLWILGSRSTNPRSPDFFEKEIPHRAPPYSTDFSDFKGWRFRAK